MITTNNLCLKYTSVAYYYIGRSLTTIFNVMFTYLILREKTSLKCISCCAFIVFGFWLGVDQEHLAGELDISIIIFLVGNYLYITGSLSIAGLIFGVLGSLSLSLYSIFTKKVLPFVNGEIWALSYANNIYASVLLIPMMLINKELPELVNYMGFKDLFFWGIITTGGICGFTIGFFTTLQIKVSLNDLCIVHQIQYVCS